MGNMVKFKYCCYIKFQSDLRFHNHNTSQKSYKPQKLTMVAFITHVMVLNYHMIHSYFYVINLLYKYCMVNLIYIFTSTAGANEFWIHLKLNHKTFWEGYLFRGYSMLSLEQIFNLNFKQKYNLLRNWSTL